MGASGWLSDVWDTITGAPSEAANAAEARQREVRDGSINENGNPSSVETDPSRDSAAAQSGDGTQASGNTSSSSSDSTEARDSASSTNSDSTEASNNTDAEESNEPEEYPDEPPSSIMDRGGEW
jgi:hypothetical protein